jgi:TolB-like protein
MQPPFAAYRGEEPYVFVSYGHEDAEEVYKDLVFLNDQGFRIWFDDGIGPGHSWPEALADAIDGCSLFLFFVSDHSANSAHCQRELHFAMDGDKPVLAVHLRDTELPRGLQFVVGDRQAVMKANLSNTQYRERLTQAVSEHVSPADEPTSEKPAQSDVFDSTRYTTVVVMPFRAAGGGEALVDLAGFATEELSVSLGLSLTLTAPSRSAIDRLAAQNLDPREIAEQLDAGMIVEASLRQVGADLRVMLELIDAITGNQIWLSRTSMPADRAEEFLSAQLELLGDHLLNRVMGYVGEKTEEIPDGELDVGALLVRGFLTPLTIVANRERAKRLMQLAIQKDAKDPRPHAALASFAADSAMQGITRDPEADRRLAKEHAALALARGGSSMPDVLSLVATPVGLLGDWTRAVELVRRAYAIAPVRQVRMTLAVSLVYAGQIDDGEAWAHLEAISNATPPGFPAPFLRIMSMCKALDGEWEEALEIAREGANRSGGYLDWLTLANVLATVDRMDEARASIEKVREGLPRFRMRAAIAGWEGTYGTEESRETATVGLKKLLEAGIE